jgi:hypothetical protein
MQIVWSWFKQCGSKITNSVARFKTTMDFGHLTQGYTTHFIPSLPFILKINAIIYPQRVGLPLKNAFYMSSTVILPIQRGATAFSLNLNLNLLRRLCQPEADYNCWSGASIGKELLRYFYRARLFESRLGLPCKIFPSGGEPVTALSCCRDMDTWTV